MDKNVIEVVDNVHLGKAIGVMQNLLVANMQEDQNLVIHAIIAKVTMLQKKV